MTTKAKTTPTSTDHPEFAQQFRDQLITTVKQGQQITLDAVQAWTKAVVAIPTPELPEIPGVSELPSTEAVTGHVFDLTNDLLNAQREFLLNVAGAVAPAATKAS
jgi:hypothetical protein